MKKRLLSSILTLCMLLSLLPTQVFAVEKGDGVPAAPESVVPDPDLLPDNDELFYLYAMQELYGDQFDSSVFSTGNQMAGEKLPNTAQKTVYELLKAEIAKIAVGTRTDTQINVAGAADVGNAIPSIVNCLLADCPYYLYWFDKETGYLQGSDGTVSFAVANGYHTDKKTSVTYRDENKNEITKEFYFEVDTDKTKAAVTAASNARKVVDDNASKSDYEKLAAYRDYICQNVSYNVDAAKNDYQGGYGDPWQMIYVFDGDPNTNVVCEGYSKAFQYLCDQTKFTDKKIQCYSVSGTTTGPHMWNIVTMDDGLNYLVDVTNCDLDAGVNNNLTAEQVTGFIGAGCLERLFLVGAAGSAAQGYTCTTPEYTYTSGSTVYTMQGGTPKYTYDTDQSTVHGADVLALAGAKYQPKTSYTATVAAASAAPVYGQALTVNISGLKLGDSIVTGGTVELYGPDATALANANVSGGAAALTYATQGKRLAVGSNTLTVKYIPAGTNAESVELGTVTVTLGKKALSGAVQTSNASAAKTYDGSANFTGVVIDLTGVETGDNVTAAASITADDANVGSKTIRSATVTLAGGDAGYYIAPAAVSGNVTITQADLPALTVTDQTVPSGQATTGVTAALPALPAGASYGTASVTNNGLVSNPAVSGTTLTYDAASQTNGTTDTITIAVNGGTNYKNGTVTVKVTAQDKQAANVTLTGAVPAAKTYGDGTFALSASAANPGTGAGTWTWTSSAPDVLTVSGSTASAAVTVVAPGSAAITASYESDTHKGSATTAAITVGKKELEITGLTATDRAYAPNNKNVALTGGTLTGKVGNDDVSVTIPASGTITDAGVGSNKTVTVTKPVPSGSDAGKYTLKDLPAITVTISRADPDVGTVSKTSPAVIYPHTALADITLTKTGTAAGRLALDAGQTLTEGTRDYSWTFTPDDTDNYNTAAGKVSLTVTADNVASIAVKTPPAKDTYTYGETFDKTGMVVEATYDSGTKKDIAAADVTVSPTTALKTVGKQTITVTYQGQTATLEVDVGKAAWKNSAKSVTLSNRDTSSQEVDLSAFLPADGGTLSYAVARTDEGAILAADPAAADGKLTFAQAADVTGEKTAEITVTVTSENYADFTVTVTVTTTGKVIPAVSARNLSKTYDGRAYADTDITGTATAAAEDETVEVEGTWSFKESTKPLNVADSGDWTVVFTPAPVDVEGTPTDVYATVETTITVTISKAQLTGTPAFTKVTASGQTLADVTLTKPAGWPEGSFSWALAGTTAVTQGTAYTWTFTPDGGNHSPAAGSVILWEAPVIVNYTITLDPAGGSVSPTTVTADGGTVPALPVPSRSGYTFTGWYNPQGNQIAAGNIIGADVTLTARWTASGGSSSGGSSGGGSSSGGSSSSGSSSSGSTSTTRNPDGSSTQTQTRTDGTKVETTTQKNGDKTVVETRKDGSSVTTVTNRDGFRATVSTSAQGEVEASVTLRPSASVVSLDIPAIRTTRDNTITVNTGTSDVTKVEVPVSNVSAGTVAVLVKADGTTEVIKTSVPTADGIIAPVKNGETISIVDNSKSFTDMGDTGWAQDAVDFVSARGIFSGTSGNTFSPASKLTRAQLMVVLASYDGADISGGSSWYEKGVEWAKNNGVSDGSNPDAVITREQLVTMLWSYAGRPSVQNQDSLSGFNDAGSVSEYARQALAWAVENHLISGVGNDLVSPQGSATRAQVAVIMRAFVSAQAK